MEKFKIISPSPVLAPFVKHYWTLESRDEENRLQRIIPTGNIELVFHKGNPMLSNGEKIPLTSICGQSLSFTDLKPTGTVYMIAVVFHPFGAKAFFDIPMNEFSHQTIATKDLNSKPLKELEDRILYTSDDNRCIGLIESFLINNLKPFKEYNYKRMVAAIQTINSGENQMSVSRLAETVCLSTKQFQRIFNEHVGITPKEFMRIVRFHKALFTLQNNPSMSFTRLAHECGYYDQSHMTSEFKLLSGYTPSEYVTICSPYSDYFSY